MADIRINALANTATTPASDDYLALDGSAQGTRKILATNIANNVTDVILGTSGPSVKSSLSARAPRQGLVFDGTAGATVSVPAFGTADFSCAGWFYATNNTVYLLSASNGGAGVYISPSGVLVVAKEGSATITSSSSYVTDGKWRHFVWTRSGTAEKLYINGILDASATDGSTLDFTQPIIRVGSWYNGTIPVNGAVVPLIYNRALSASEVVALYEAGAPAGADYGQGTNDSGATVYSGQQMVNGDNSTFASDTGWWTKASGVSITGGKLVLSSVATGSAAILRNSVLKIGIRYRVTFTISNYSAGGVKIQFGGTSGSTRTANGTYTEEVVCGSSNTNLYPLVTVGTTTLDVDDLTVTPSGLLLAPDAAQAGGGLVWYDTSGNAANITLPASGVSWNVPSSGYWGGNLTVNGTTASIGGAASSWDLNAIQVLRGAIYGAGNETGYYNNANYSGGWKYTASAGASGYLQNAGTHQWYTAASGTAGNTITFAEAARITSGGNVLIGTTTDGGNGKLQLATHTTSAGGIGFGSDTSLYRTGQGSLAIDGGTLPILRFFNGATQYGYVYAGSSDGELACVTGPLRLKSNNTTALTLDNSQNATFAGTVRSNTQEGFKIAAASGYFAGYEADGTTLNGYLQFINSIGTLLNQSIAGKNIALAIAGTPQLTLTTGNATFAGTVTANGGTASILNTTSGGVADIIAYTSGGSGDIARLRIRNNTSHWHIQSIEGTGSLEVGVVGVGNYLVVSSAGSLRLNAYGAGTLSTDASGNVTASSDARLKTNLRTFARGLADVLKLAPKTYNWNETSGMDTDNDYVGFVAQDVQSAIPEAVYEGKDANKTLTLNDRAILAALVNAVKELNAKLA